MGRWAGMVAAALVAALSGGACGASTGSPAASSSAATATAQTYTVQLDGKADAFNAEFSSFLPNEVGVHPGDTIRFSLPHFTGEPHTVTLGTLVDGAVGRLRQLGPRATLAAMENSAEMLRLPDIFPHKLPQGPPDANQSAAQPCYLDSGVPPVSLTGSAPACPRRDQPAFTGTQAFYNSGALFDDGASYSVKLADTVKPGVYAAMCMVHREAMTAKITVADPATTVPTPAQVSAKARDQLAAKVTALTPLAARGETNTASGVSAGLLQPPNVDSVVAEFGPKSVSVPVQGSVTWNVLSFHSISFNAAESDVGALVRSADGGIHLNPRAGAPMGFTLPPAAFEFPPPDDGKPITVDAGTWDGTGFKSTGIIGSLPPVLIAVKMSFSKAGTYAYRCLVHPDMKGEVKVG